MDQLVVVRGRFALSRGGELFDFERYLRESVLYPVQPSDERGDGFLGGREPVVRVRGLVTRCVDRFVDAVL